MWMLPMPSGSGEIKFGSMSFTGNIYIHVSSHKHSVAQHGYWRCFISADMQICQCFNKLRHHIVIPQLHAVLTMGTTFSTYKLDKPSKQVTPAEILSTDEDTIQDLAPRSWWKHEILEPAGEAIFLEIVEDVKVMSFNI